MHRYARDNIDVTPVHALNEGIEMKVACTVHAGMDGSDQSWASLFSMLIPGVFFSHAVMSEIQLLPKTDGCFKSVR